MTSGVRSREDLAWAAGLFEGEGCFGTSRPHNPETTLSMSDRDRVERMRDVMGFGTLHYVKPQRDGWKALWKWRAGGHEYTQATLAMLWEWLGPRRRAKAIETLRAHREHAALDLLAPKPCPNGCGLVTRPGPLAKHRLRCDRDTRLDLVGGKI